MAEVNANNLEWFIKSMGLVHQLPLPPDCFFPELSCRIWLGRRPWLVLGAISFPWSLASPLIPTDYIKNLPMWRFKCLGVQSEERNVGGFSRYWEWLQTVRAQTLWAVRRKYLKDKLSIIHSSPGKASHCDAEACSCANKYCQTSPYERKGAVPMNHIVLMKIWNLIG